MSARPQAHQTRVRRSEVIAVARQYLGVPWVHQGRTRAGLDCGGLIVRVAHDLGLSEFDVGGYGPEPDGRLLRRYLQAQAEHVLFAERGDILLLRFVRYPQHLGIYTGEGIIHTYQQVGRVVEHAFDSTWRARVVDAYSYPGVLPATVH
jgi:cell wall-associated NlpC family hydrolase